jgi:hypothetical protein
VCRVLAGQCAVPAVLGITLGEVIAAETTTREVSTSGLHAGEKRTVFQVIRADPVAPDAPSQQYEVLVMSDAAGSPAGYRLTVHVNVCNEGLCRMVHVTLYWDALG